MCLLKCIHVHWRPENGWTLSSCLVPPMALNSLLVLLGSEAACGSGFQPWPRTLAISEADPKLEFLGSVRLFRNFRKDPGPTS